MIVDSETIGLIFVLIMDLTWFFVKAIIVSIIKCGVFVVQVLELYVANIYCFFFFFFFEKVLKRQLIYEIHGNLSSWTIKLSDSYYTHKNIKKSHGHFRQKTPQPFIYKTLPLQPRATFFPFFYFAASP